MSEIDEPTTAERAAEEYLCARIEELSGDPVQTQWHMWSCRRRTERLTGAVGGRFSSYLTALATELPLLLVDPQACRTAFENQQRVNRAKQDLAEQEDQR